MRQLGFGVMMRMLVGNEKSYTTYTASVGKTIEKVYLADDELVFQFTDGTGMKLVDEGQSCCEHRYMTTDDDLSFYSGATLDGAEIVDGPEQEGEYGDLHDIQFLNVITSKGVFQMASHNEHNGYYGGFSIEAKPV